MLGERLKHRRLELNLTQRELSEGICKQSQISRIENQNYDPSASILKELSNRLNVSMDYFFNTQLEADNSVLKSFKEIADDALAHRDFNRLDYCLTLELDKKKTITLEEDLVYLEWIKAIIEFNVQKDFEKAITMMENLCKRIKTYNEYYLDFFNTLALFYFECDKIENYKKLYKFLMEEIYKVDMTKQNNILKVIKIRYNYARILVKNKVIKEALDEILETIEICKQNSSFYLLAELYCLLSNIGDEFLSEEDIIMYYEQAKFLYKLLGNEKMYLKIQEYLCSRFFTTNNISSRIK